MIHGFYDFQTLVNFFQKWKKYELGMAGITRDWPWLVIFFKNEKSWPIAANHGLNPWKTRDWLRFSRDFHVISCDRPKPVKKPWLAQNPWKGRDWPWVSRDFHVNHSQSRPNPWFTRDLPAIDPNQWFSQFGENKSANKLIFTVLFAIWRDKKCK